MSKQIEKSRYYSSTFKEQVLSRILSGEFSVYEASVHYRIGGNMTIYRWLHKYAPEWRKKPIGIQNVMAESTPQKTDILSAEVQSLKHLLEAERLRSEAYLTMIKLAEEKYGIPIEKKSGAKQSKR